MASKKEPRFEEKSYLGGDDSGGWSENDITYGGKTVMKNAPSEYANELQREMGRAKTMKNVNAQQSEKPPSKQSMQDAADEAMRRKEERAPTTRSTMGSVFKKGGKVSSASKRADGCAIRGKTRGKMV